jgi:hypothetical protein
VGEEDGDLENNFGDDHNLGQFKANLSGYAELPAVITTGAGQLTATVTLSANDIQAVAAQGLAAHDLATVLQAMSNGAVYVNVITDKFANGEIRGQLIRGFSFGHGIGIGRGR